MERLCRKLRALFICSVVILTLFVLLQRSLRTTSRIKTAAEIKKVVTDLYVYNIQKAKDRVFDVRKMCDKICDRTMQTCFSTDITIFVYKNAEPKQMLFEQTFDKWKRKEEGFSSKRKQCPINEIDSSFETLTMQPKCAIVGNSGILLKSKCGNEIDKHNYVMRANMAETEGFSDDVGNKTTLMMINCEMTTKIFNDTIFPDNSTVYDSIMDNLRSLNDSILWFAKGLPHGSPFSKQLHDIAGYVKKKNLNTRFAFSYKTAGGLAKKRWKMETYPSSGLIMLMAAETFCEEITLYGFYPYEKNPQGAPVLHHYFDPRLVNFSTPVHNFDNEHKFLQSLHKKGTIRLVIDPCES
ncbi:alpha-2,8-sialyltransferase 8B-like isoform X1 [Apostichopus japonicus]|uniref:alpha-2,8-sialyltransferase 8B-like isoform X1 n=1 Tax=Stichopus japonicus TaxID=307972 RepID=UPI003AB1BFD2